MSDVDDGYYKGVSWSLGASPSIPTLRSLIHVLNHIAPHLFRNAVELTQRARQDQQRFFFIGNGGSAAIASHMAADWLKAAGVAAMSFNEPAQLTCIANDLGYEYVFAKPLLLHGKPGDLLFALSSSGRSRSITYAAETALTLKMRVITLSGFDADNPLRKLGDVNFHVPSDRYGIVEVAHHAICHSILDAVIS